MSPDEFERYRQRLTRTVRTKLKVCDEEGCICGNKCVVWTGSRDSSGYALVKMHGKVTLVHRFVYTRLVGPIELADDDDATLDHLCKPHRVCCNVNHMEIVSRSENSRRANHRRHHEGFSRDKTK